MADQGDGNDLVVLDVADTDSIFLIGVFSLCLFERGLCQWLASSESCAATLWAKDNATAKSSPRDGSILYIGLSISMKSRAVVALWRPFTVES